MPPRRVVPRRRPASDGPPVPPDHLAPGGKVPSPATDPEHPRRLWALGAWLEEADPAHLWHDALSVLLWTDPDALVVDLLHEHAALNPPTSKEPHA